MNKKSIFDYLHPNRTDSKKAESIEQIAAISHSCDAVGWRPVPYKIPEEYSAFIENIDRDVLDFINQAKPDMYNAKFYDQRQQCGKSPQSPPHTADRTQTGNP